MNDTFGEVVVFLYTEYKKALKLSHVKNPMAYALYQTWKKYDDTNKGETE